MKTVKTNPISWVAPFKSGQSSASDIPDSDKKDVICPCSYVWSESDVSKSTAGRSESGKMYKEKIGSVVKVELGWDNIDTVAVHQILNLFKSEYVWVRLIDPKKDPISPNPGVTPVDPSNPGHYRHTDLFYVGDRSAPMYNASMGLWSNVSFNLIERTPHD